jgi:hypothetical protein
MLGMEAARVTLAAISLTCCRPFVGFRRSIPSMSLRDPRRPATRRTLIALWSLALVALGCGHERRASARSDTAGDARANAAQAAEPVLPSYHVVDVARGGAIVGRVTTSAEPPADSVVPVTIDQALCGAEQRIPLVERRGDRLANVVVWLADARRGKPLPVERRFEITATGCTLEPRVQAAIAGGMLNVRSLDATTHRTRFARNDAVLDVVQETDWGQVVPTEKVLARPGLVEARCTLHPWARAWIRVFDHPYFAVTNRDGTFTIDSVPPGTYHLVAWQARLGVKEQMVTVEATKDAKVTVAF